MGIRGQLTVVPAIVAVALIFAASVILRQQRAEDFEEFRLRNEKVLEAIGVTVAVYVAQNDMGNLDTLIAQLTDSLKERDFMEIAVLDADRRVLAHSEPERFNTELIDEFSRQATQTEGPTWAREHDVLRISVPARSGIRWATVEARLSMKHLNALGNRSAVQWVLGALVLFLFISAALYVGLNRMVVVPLRSLQQAVRRMKEGHLTVRAPSLRGRELSDLSDTVNSMALALQTERENLEKMVAERTRELQEANQRLEKIAVTDGLTGLFNHRRFQEVLAAEMLRSERHKRPLGVLMVDVDFFKKVNDTKGHPVGDELLRRLGSVMKEALRQTDIMARYGGEEFGAVLPETTKAEALQVAERIREAVEKSLNEPETFGQSVTVSIGAATFPEDGATGQEVLNAADQALYLAKRQGRNRVVGAKAS